MGAGCLWGTLGIFAKTIFSLSTIGPISLTWLRNLFAITVLGLLIAFRHYDVSLTRREIGLFAGFGFCSVIFQSLIFTSYTYTTLQHAVALLYTSPAFVAILARIILKERLTSRKIAAVMLAIAGTFLILGFMRGEHLFASRTQIGDLLALGAGLASSSSYIFGKVLGRNREPAVTTFAGLCFVVMLLVPPMGLLEGFRLPETSAVWMLLAAMGIIPTTMAFLLYFAGLKLIEASRASIFAITEPVMATILAFLIFHETPTPDSFLGFGLIISSILIISLTKK